MIPPERLRSGDCYTERLPVREGGQAMRRINRRGEIE